MTNADRKELARMGRAISALPEPTRTIYRLHLHGLDFAAIAGMLGTRPVDIERAIARAIVLIERTLRCGP